MVHARNKVKLKINPEPFKPSNLSIPPSPFSPQTPVTNFNTRPLTRRTKTYPPPDATATPPDPLQWVWQCHQCHRSYALGVTRRCLEDGHQFCAGTTTIKAWRKPLRAKRVKKHRACASEFDYQGWKNWGRWRRSGARKDSIYDSDRSSPSSSSSSSFSSSSSEDECASQHHSYTTSAKSSTPYKDCWNACDYPSECRWGRQFGIHTPIATTFPTLDIPSAAAATSSSLSNPDPTTTTTPSPTTQLTPTTITATPPSSTTLNNTSVEGVLKPENYPEPRDRKSSKPDLWDALVASAIRRKSVPPSSPLACAAEGAGGAATISSSSSSSSPQVETDRDGDVIMSPPPPVAESPASPPSATAPMTFMSFKDVFRKKSKVYSRFVKKVSEGKSVDEALEELAPLERVKTRDSGYHSSQAWY